MIQKIIIKKVSTYDDNGVEINELKKVNFFFGYNGAGKSTIAKYLYNLSLEEKFDDKFIECDQIGYDKEKIYLKILEKNIII